MTFLAYVDRSSFEVVAQHRQVSVFDVIDPAAPATAVAVHAVAGRGRTRLRRRISSWTADGSRRRYVNC